VNRQRVLARFRDQPFLVRHVAWMVAAVAVAAFASRSRLDNRLLLALAAAALANLATYLLAGLPAASAAVAKASPVVGIASWAPIIHATGGVESPLVAGYWLEVLLAGVTLGPLGAVLACAGSLVALWVPPHLLGYAAPASRLWSHTFFLLAAGGVTLFLVQRLRHSEERISRTLQEAQERLDRLERELDDARTLSRVGENVAHLAHGIKNAVHSLRGFLRLLEPAAAGGDSAATLEGLRRAVDQLEELARWTLGGAEPTRVEFASAAEVAGAISAAVEDLGRTAPAIRVRAAVGEGLPAVRMPAPALQETLTVLLRNAAEAMGGSGELSIEARREATSLRLVVSDHGRGFSAEALARLFEPGFTTKPGGSGFGLFLLRRLLEARGGTVEATSLPGGGAAFSLSVPALEG